MSVEGECCCFLSVCIQKRKLEGRYQKQSFSFKWLKGDGERGQGKKKKKKMCGSSSTQDILGRQVT